MVMTRIPARPLCVTHYGPFLRLAGLGPKASGGRSKSTTTTPRLFHQVSVSDSYDLLMPPTYLGQPINDSMAEEPAVTPEAIEAKLKEAPIEASHVKAVDLSDGCGAKFDILVVSTAFQGKPLLARHRAVNAALAEEIKRIHAITLKTYTPEQWEEIKSKQEA